MNISSISDLSLLSKYRSQLMGFATIWIAFYHMSLVFYIPVISEIRWSGYGGVDIFLLVSGIGIYFSWQKDSHISIFYKKRFLRILPIYIVIQSIFYIFSFIEFNTPIDILFYQITTLAFWVTKMPIPWFIPAILALYIISPLFFYLFKQKLALGTILATSVFIAISLLITNTEYSDFLILTSRAPNYFIGIFIGYLISQKYILNKKQISVLLLSLIIGIAYFSFVYIIKDYSFLRYGLVWYPFLLIATPLSLVICGFFNCFDKYKFSVLFFIGQYSLPIYLIHDKLLFVLEYYAPTYSKSVINIIAFLLTILVAYILQKTVYRLIKI